MIAQLLAATQVACGDHFPKSSTSSAQLHQPGPVFPGHATRKVRSCKNHRIGAAGWHRQHIHPLRRRAWTFAPRCLSGGPPTAPPSVQAEILVTPTASTRVHRAGHRRWPICDHRPGSHFRQVPQPIEKMVRRRTFTTAGRNARQRMRPSCASDQVNLGQHRQHGTWRPAMGIWPALLLARFRPFRGSHWVSGRDLLVLSTSWRPRVGLVSSGRPS